MPVALKYISVKGPDGLTLYAVFRRVSDLGYFNTFTGAFESFTAANWYGSGANNYSVAATKTVQSANVVADYASPVPSMPAGAYWAEWYIQQGTNPAVTDGQPAWKTEDILWNGTTLLPSVNSGGNEVVDLGTNGDKTGYSLASSQSFNNSGQTTALPATYSPAVSGTASSGSTIAIDGTKITWPINYALSQPFTAYNVDSTGWTQFVFTIKTNKTDADSAALVTVVVSNPGVGTDGLTVINGAAPSGSTTSADGSLSVTGISTNTSITLTLTARGHALAQGHYSWELTRYSGGSGTKYLVGRGAWTAVQSVRVNPVAS